jgi:hypothetical protein
MTRINVESCQRITVADFVAKVGSREAFLEALGRGDKISVTIGLADDAVTQPIRFALAQTPTGGLRAYLICDLVANGRYCGRRVTALYLPPTAKYLGCRCCYNLSYQSQHEHSSKFVRIMRIMQRTLFQPMDDIEALERYLDRRGAPKGRSPLPIERTERSMRLLDRALGIEERSWDGLKRPRRRGRPREKRPYHRRKLLSLTPPQPGQLEAFCVRCRDRRPIVFAKEVHLANGMPAIRGQCMECGTITYRIRERDGEVTDGGG